MLLRNHVPRIYTAETENVKQSVLVRRVLLLKVHTWRLHAFLKTLVTVDLCYGGDTRNLGCSFTGTHIFVISLKRISPCEFWDTVLGNGDSEILHQRKKRGRKFFS